MKVHLEVLADRRDGKPRVIARVLFKNDSPQPVEVAKFLIGSGESPILPLFHLKSNGNEIPFKGKMIKPEHPIKEDFATLLPQQEVQGIFDLSIHYQWFLTPAEYVIRYETRNLYSNTDILLKSAETTFRF